MSGGTIQLRVPIRLGSGEEITFRLAMTDQDARTLVDAPRRSVRALEDGLVQKIRDGLRKFLDQETGDQE